MTSAKGSSYDYGLRLYRDLLGLEHLHFGLWAPEDPRDLEGFRTAQERYMQRLLDRFPEGVRRVLDVGAGTGALSLAARERGYEVEALSPCEHQEKALREKTNGDLPFHLARFQDFEPPHRYDLVVCSESAQYVPRHDLFERAKACLTPDGHLLVCDYFRLQPERFYRAAHVLQEFDDAAKESGFRLVEAEDITESVLQTLEVGRDLYDRFVLPLADIARDWASREKPKTSWLAQRVFGKRLKKFQGYLYEKTPAKLDVDAFRERVRYRTMLFAAPVGGAREVRNPAVAGEPAPHGEPSRPAQPPSVTA
ncbi:MAG: class I SAM-dependent methyltransferase [Planctomycetota bacterium]